MVFFSYYPSRTTKFEFLTSSSNKCANMFVFLALGAGLPASADIHDVMKSALHQMVYVRLEGAEPARRLLQTVPALQSVYQTDLKKHPFFAVARRSPLDNSTKTADISRIASLMSMRAALLELHEWAAASDHPELTNSTAQAGRRLDILDKLGKVINPYLDPTKQQEIYSAGVGKLLGNNCPKLEERPPPSNIEKVGLQDVYMVLCAGDSPLLGVNAKGSTLLGAEILKEMRKADAVARYQGASVASNKALRANLHSGYEEAMAVYPGASFACGVDDDASSLPNLISRNKAVRASEAARGLPAIMSSSSPPRAGCGHVEETQRWLGGQDELQRGGEHRVRQERRVAHRLHQELASPQRCDPRRLHFGGEFARARRHLLIVDFRHAQLLSPPS